MRQLFPPVAPEPPNLNPPPDLEAENEPVETNLTEDQSTESETVETMPVETKLIDGVTHSILYTAMPPISRPAEPAPIAATEHQRKCIAHVASNKAYTNCD